MFYEPRSKCLLAVVIVVMLFIQFTNYRSIHSKFLYGLVEAIKYWGDSTQYGKIGNKHPNDGFGERTMGYGMALVMKMLKAMGLFNDTHFTF